MCQDIVCYLHASRWSSHTYAEPSEGLGSEMLTYRTQAVVSTHASADLPAHLTEGQLDIVMNNKNIRRCNPEEMRCLLYGDAAFIHVGLRL